MKKWYHLEATAHNFADFDKLSKTYEKVYKAYAANGSVHAKLKKIRPELEYLIMRLIFINPVSLPVMSEGYLRKDFHFALYLSYCFGKTLTNFFKWSLWCLIIALVLVVTVNITFDAIGSDEVKLYFEFTLTVVCLITLILLKCCLTSAEKKLTPNVYDREGKLRDPEYMNICFNERMGNIDPFL